MNPDGIKIHFLLVTSCSRSVKAMLDKSGLPDTHALTQNALSWYKKFRDTKAAGKHLIARNPRTEGFIYFSDDVRGGDLSLGPHLAEVSERDVEMIRTRFPGETENATLTNAFLVLDRVIEAQTSGLKMAELDGKTRQYKDIRL